MYEYRMKRSCEAAASTKWAKITQMGEYFWIFSIVGNWNFTASFFQNMLPSTMSLFSIKNSCRIKIAA
jgi:hypothetical protein